MTRDGAISDVELVLRGLEAEELDDLERRARRRLASELERERLRPVPPPMTTRKGRA